MNEFELIKRYFAPLAHGYTGSLNLTDDAAIIAIPDGEELVITKDALSEGVHFLGSENPALIAKKLLRVNLSDLAAMSAKPLAYFLAVIFPPSISEDWIKSFAQGLAEDQKEFNIHLAGGDTIATHGPLSFSLTALGTVPKGKALKRSGAQIGDSIFVSGTLGDSALGLELLKKSWQGYLSQENKTFLEQHYYLPEPKIALGQALQTIATACIDISDGLVQDISHICAASKKKAEIKAEKLPLSQAAQHMIALEPQLGMHIFSGGDDYELLFTVPPDKITLVPHQCSLIGVIKEGSGVTVLDPNGNAMSLPVKGYQHFN